MANLKFREIGEAYTNICNQLRKESIAYLNEVLAENNNYIDLRKIEEDGGDSVCVTYDGGRHPEYASNPYSTVYAVYKKDGSDTIYLEVEETDDYDIDRVETEELYGVADFVSCCI